MVHQNAVSDSGGRQSKVVDDILADISQHGWAVIGVFPVSDEPSVGFSYSVGLSAKGLPELAVYGLDPQSAGGLLNRVAQSMVDRGAAIQPGEWLDGTGKHVQAETRACSDVLVAIDMRDTSDLGMVRTIYGEVESAIQLVWPMRDGLMPWEIGGRATEEQPMLGPPVGTPALYRPRRLGDVFTFAELAQALPSAIDANESTAPELLDSNDRRVHWAGMAFIEYAIKVGIYDDQPDELYTHLGDLISDLRHFADALGADWGNLITTAERNYRAEIHGVI